MRVADLFIHPVKGMRAWPVREVAVEPWGLAGDRRWVVVDGRGRAATQREHPALARIVARPTLDGIVLSSEEAGEAEVPFPDGAAESVRMFGDSATGSRVGPAASEWLRRVLGAPVELFHMREPAIARPLRAPGAEPGDRLSYADAYPVLLASATSLAALNQALGPARRVGMDRFRPNIVVEGTDAWAEDAWTGVAVGDVAFHRPTDCQRCIVITVDQLTGAIPSPGEPLKTLTRLDRSGAGLPLFGRNLIPDVPGVIRVGDVVHATTGGEAASGPRDATAGTRRRR